jgi:hypothetical protein
MKVDGLNVKPEYESGILGLKRIYFKNKNRFKS